MPVNKNDHSLSTRYGGTDTGMKMVRNKLKNINNKSHRGGCFDALAHLKSHDSVREGKACLAKLISPITIPEFFQTVWERRPLYISRQDPSFYEYICTLQDFNEALSTEEIYFTENVDVTSYKDGVKVTENLNGRVTPEIAEDLCREGKSLRLLNPHTFIYKVRSLTTKLQEYFRCFVGANIYLTPAKSQGFAPHYDDVEAFVLQLAGRKEWKIYSPRSGKSLPRFSSGNFTDADVGEPLLKVILETGDMVYFPRGVIHQARSLDEGSMHITISCYQRNSWGDFLEKLLPVALQRAIDEEVEYRKGLPRNYLDHLGLVASDRDSKTRANIISHIKKLMDNLSHYLPIDSCADQFGKNFVHDALPPILGKDELIYGAKCGKVGSKDRLTASLNRNIRIKLIRAYTCRLVCEDEKFKLYYSTKNGLNYHEIGHRCIALSGTWAIMAETLLKRYPNFTGLKRLSLVAGGLHKMDSALRFVKKLWKRGLIIFDMPVS